MVVKPPEKPFYESLKFKSVVAVVIILIFATIFFVQSGTDKNSAASGTGQRPMKSLTPKAPEFPVSKARELSLPQPSFENRTDRGYSSPPLSGQDKFPPSPRDSAPVGRPQEYPLSAPATEVHPLSDAGAVMGQPAGGVGEIGVTKTYKLPPQNQGNRNPTSPGDPNRP